MKKRKLRKKIAKRVSDKMCYMNTCMNARDILLNIILGKKDRYPWALHCETNCLNQMCACHPLYKKEEASDI